MRQRQLTELQQGLLDTATRGYLPTSKIYSSQRQLEAIIERRIRAHMNVLFKLKWAKRHLIRPQSRQSESKEECGVIRDRIGGKLAGPFACLGCHSGGLLRGGWVYPRIRVQGQHPKDGSVRPLGLAGEL